MIENLVPAVSGGLQLYKAYKDFNAPDIDYDILQLTAEQKEIEAESVLADVENEANNLREQFIEDIGTYKAMKARRGVKVDEGGVAQNIERSAKNVGEDVQTMRGNAKYKSDQLKRKADQYRAGAEAQKEIGYWDRMGKAMRGVMGAMESFEMIDWGGEGEGGQGGGAEGATTAMTGGDPIIGTAVAMKKKQKKELVKMSNYYSGQDTMSTVSSFTIPDEKVTSANTGRYAYRGI